MVITRITPRVALNKSYLKVKPNRSDIERFKINLIELLDQINEKESEEFHKNIISKFLDKTYYSGSHYINTKGRNDLVIHLDKDSKSNVGVIIETKQPTKKNEMVQVDKLNTKAFQELVLYYMRERISEKNIDIKNLIITNIYEWFIFDVDVFEKAFAQNIDFVKRFVDFEQKRLSGKNTDFFYKEIAEPAIDTLLAGNTKLGKDVFFTHFDIREYESVVRNQDKADDNKLISLFKLLSPEHLLKLPFKNDSNSLDKGFYSELLHIIGLTEVKDGGKKFIKRKSNEDRDEGAIIENAINQLESLDKLSRIEKPSLYGDTNSERYFNVALELTITWINRILFLKLLEAQLLTYQKGNKEYAFLNKEKIKSFDDLNGLFFQVLAREIKDRSSTINSIFKNVPYLNSSLFEPTDLEQVCFPISQLQDNKQLSILSNTVLKDNNGKRKSGVTFALEYLFDFLDSYDFSSEGSEQIQEENKTLISASVLGLIFEKINGYKDGSFFTPGFITMYMCRETIRRAVVQKFNEKKGWNCQSYDELYDKIQDKKEANAIIDDIKIIDPAVGSGHFLVSALNEIIAIKSDLKILLDRSGKTLRDYTILVTNDELTVTDDNGRLFEYNPRNQESQRVQEALFHEKQRIIEGSLFGVDINTNSVKICRLRLWIELLKHAYYRQNSDFTELETLPNIDINIKCGNSLISRYALDVDISQALKKSKISIKQYRECVQGYRHAVNKEQKREMETLISRIKGDFRTEISNNDPIVKKLRSKRGEYEKLVNQHQLFEQTASELKSQRKKEDALRIEVEKLEGQIDEIKNNKLFLNAFEWRFEFPEVLNENGDYVGFDIVIGNPPYGALVDESSKTFFKDRFSVVQGPFEVYKFFIEQGLKLLATAKHLCYISPDTWINLSYFKKLRRFIYDNAELIQCTKTLYDVFEEATVDTNIYILSNHQSDMKSFEIIDQRLVVAGQGFLAESEDDIIVSLKAKPSLISKIEDGCEPLEKIMNVWRGMSAYGAANPAKPFNSMSKDTEFHRPVLNGGDISKYGITWSGEYIKYGEWLHRPRPAYIYDRPHLLVQRIRNPRLRERIIATFDDEKFISSDGLSNLVLKDEKDDLDTLMIVLGILNSSVINYWFSFYYFDVNIKPEQLRRIPIKQNIDKTIAHKLVELVKEAITSKKSGVASSFNTIFDKIDELVFKIYDLSNEEVKLINQ